MRLFLSIIVLFLSLPSFGSVCESKGPNVVLFTMDGVRSHEFFKGTAPLRDLQLPRSERGRIFSTFWSKYANRGMVLGSGKRHKIASSIAISLPSYQALMAGHATPCRNNGCGPIKEETVLEAIRRTLNLDKKEVAAFASWDGLLSAVASDLSNVSYGIYPAIFDDGVADVEMLELQRKAMEDLPSWHGSRKDKYTFELGMQYLKKHCPRLLYISLVDSDEFGHSKDYPNYVRSLRTYDQYIDQLIQTLDKMGEYGKQTTLIITTDHSRGFGPFWGDHAVTKNSEKKVFLYATGRGVQSSGVIRKNSNHGQIRPTIEFLLGAPVSGPILPDIKL